MRLIWFAQAEYDIDHHITYIEDRNPTAAVDQNILIEEAIEKLVNFPLLGKAGRRAGTRELVVPSTSFIAVYRVDMNLDEIHILRILHARQKYPPE